VLVIHALPKMIVMDPWCVTAESVAAVVAVGVMEHVHLQGYYMVAGKHFMVLF
jgi:hypothetical protein